MARIWIIVVTASSLISFLPARSDAQTEPDERVHVHVESASPGLRLYYAHEGRDARALCVAPCDLTLRRGLHDFAVGPHRGARLPVPVVSLEVDSTLRLDCESNGTARAIGGLFSGLGIAAGLLGTISGAMALAVGDGLDVPVGAAFLGGGSALIVLGVIGAVLFGTWDDTGHVEVRPFRPGP